MEQEKIEEGEEITDERKKMGGNPIDCPVHSFMSKRSVRTAFL
jgi:hypothetical protein